VIQKSDIVAIDNDEDNLAVVWKLVPDTDLAIIQKFDSSITSRNFLSTARLTVIQSVKDSKRRRRRTKTK